MRDVQGCCLSAEELNLVAPPGTAEVFSLTQEEPLIPASGDEVFDRALGRALVRLARTFDVRPGFAYIDDGQSKNAYATPETRIPRTHGTVLFGLNLLREALHMGIGGDIAVLGICAHEFAHIFQFFSHYYRELESRHHTVKLIELHADYLSGYFIGRLKQDRPSIRLYNFGRLINSIGDTNFNNPSHHGTSEERVRAAETGFRAASSVSSAQSAARQGFEFVVRSFT